MLNTVSERGKYWYDYSEYLAIAFCKSFCCCFVSRRDWFKRRLKKLERHEEASERLNSEIDIVKFVYTLRIVHLIAKLTLKKHQRALISSFKAYQIDDLNQVQD